MAEPARVLLFHEDRAIAAPVRERFVAAGYAVSGARSFLEAAPWFVPGRVDVLVMYVPAVAWVRNAILAEARRANPTLPIVAVTADSRELAPVLARLHRATAVDAGDGWPAVLHAVRDALGGGAT